MSAAKQKAVSRKQNAVGAAEEKDGRVEAENPVSFLALADSVDRRDRAAAFASRLAAGMGSRVGPPRSYARRMGQAELAIKKLPALAKHQRILGCALDANLPVGGRDAPRRAFRSADAS